MSKILGRAYDVLNTVNYIQESGIPRYKWDKNKSSWESIEEVPNKLKIYLPESAIEFIEKEKIEIKKSPLRFYTLTNVPEYEDETRYIRFCSNKPYKEFEREYSFYIGCLLSSYQIDTEEELLEMGKEYDDLLPILFDYLYLKTYGDENRFSLKHIHEIKYFSRVFAKIFQNYNNFCEFYNNAETRSLTDEEYKSFQEVSYDRDEGMEKSTMENIVKLSALDAVLQLKDKDLGPDEYKKLIEDLMINKDESRSSILYEKGIDSYGYKRLRKEIDIIKKAK